MYVVLCDEQESIGDIYFIIYLPLGKWLCDISYGGISVKFMSNVNCFNC
jgi:hypothetical protein